MIGNIGADASVNANVSADVSVQADLSAALDASLSAGFDASASLSLGKASKCQVGKHDPDPFLAFRFKVEISGMKSAMRFKSCGAIGVTSSWEDVPNGGSKYPAKMLPPKTRKWNGVTLSRGIAPDGKEIWRWVMETTSGWIDPREVTISLLNPDGSPGIQWTFHNAYPTGWSLTPFDSTSTVAVETITLAHHGVKVQFGGESFESQDLAAKPASQANKNDANKGQDKSGTKTGNNTPNNSKGSANGQNTPASKGNPGDTSSTSSQNNGASGNQNGNAGQS